MASSTDQSDQQARSEPEYVSLNTKDLPWWSENIDKHTTEEFVTLLEEQGRIPRPQIREHIYTIREKLWGRRSYPCTGLGHFQLCAVSNLSCYQRILQVLRQDAAAKFLDIGCYVGVDLRRLVADGISPSKVIGCDIISHWDIGFELFNDKNSFDTTYFDGDLLKPEESQLAKLMGKVDVVYQSSVIHQWPRDIQKQAFTHCARLSKGAGSFVVGRQCGVQNGHAREFDTNKQTKGKTAIAQPWAHDEGSLKQMWSEICNDTETEWNVEVSFRSWSHFGFDADGMAYLGEDAGFLEYCFERKGASTLSR